MNECNLDMKIKYTSLQQSSSTSLNRDMKVFTMHTELKKLTQREYTGKFVDTIVETCIIGPL